jgi:hypothetical protein
MVRYALLLGALAITTSFARKNPVAYPDRFNVVWTSPSADSHGSMPLGNGDIGVNVWVEPTGDLCLYLAKTDAFDENNRLLKVGKLRFRLPSADLTNFRQELRLATGEVHVSAGPPKNRRTWRVWVDAAHPLVHVELAGPRPTGLLVQTEPWRTRTRPFTGGTDGTEIHAAYGLQGYKGPVSSHADTLLRQPDHLVWCHRNRNDAFDGQTLFAFTLAQQGLTPAYQPAADPLRNRTVGAVAWGQNLVSESENRLRAAAPAAAFHVVIGLLTNQAATVADWQRDAVALSHSAETQPLVALKAAHDARWRNFWQTSRLDLSGSPQADSVAQGYALQRFVMACATGGTLPPKFNGSLFNVDATETLFGKPTQLDPDYRRWGGCYWFQNTRLMYWPLLASGDFGRMKGLFDLYLDALPLAKARVRSYFGHAGAMFPETMTFWGAYAPENYGWHSTGSAAPGGYPGFEGFVTNPYVRYYYQGALELSLMMLDYHDFTQDTPYFRENLLPFVDEILTFYAEHYADRDGTIWMYPAQSLENHWNVINPTPDLAGLRAVTARVLALPTDVATPAQRTRWQRLRARLPELPLTRWQGKPVVADAAQLLSRQIRNTENPALYAVFPYRLLTLGQPGLDTARATYAARRFPGHVGWRQDEIQAALLGLTDEVRRGLAQRFEERNPQERFPAFWGPNFDWTPDQDHGSAGVMALQTALVQSVGEKIYVLPAWPRAWNVRFKLHAPRQTTVEGEYRDGQLLRLDVTPAARRADVVIQPTP